jgi:hypothetical protein
MLLHLADRNYLAIRFVVKISMNAKSQCTRRRHMSPEMSDSVLETVSEKFVAADQPIPSPCPMDTG